jgi:hypothetical protein
LESAAFTPLLRVTYLLNVGRGYHRLGNSDAGAPYLERAIELASQQQLNQLLFEAESALSDAKRRVTPTHTKPTEWVDPALQPVVSAIQELKATAGIS